MPTATRNDPYLVRDISHSLIVAALACLASGGLVYLGYLGHAAWVAARSGHRTDAGDYLLVFGKRLNNRAPDADFRQRLAHARWMAEAFPQRRLILLGGGEAGVTEAEVGLQTLRGMGLPEQIPVLLENQSLDTLQNLRNAREMLAARGTGSVLLLSSRYHLARCARLAAQLGFDFHLCAAEPRFVPSPRNLLRIGMEAGYLCWLDVGARWARLIGHQRMMDRIS